jgi:hypothetical protein
MITKPNTATKQADPATTINQLAVSESPKTTAAATPTPPPEAAARPPATSPTWVAPRASDGFDAVLDADGNRSIIRGAKYKFTNNAEWLDDAGEVVDPAREFLVFEIAKVTQKWIDGMPAETRILAPDEYFPDTERLNAGAPPKEWREAFGKQVGPWQNSIVVYLFDPTTMECFTWPTSTAGGFRAVDDLQARVKRARRLQGDNVFPVVTLADTHMNTQYGGRQRPALKVVRFIAIGGQAKPLLDEPKAEAMNDQIPY